MAPLKSSDGKTTGKLISLQQTSLLGEGIASPFSASGGTEYTGPNDMKYHIFTPTTPAPANTLVVSTTGTIYLLLVAGGGGGGSQHAGGGGAGALYYREDYPVPGATYPVTIGSGGSGGTAASGTPATAGSNSVFGAVTLNGGGTGGAMNNVGGGGGCGGGGGMRPIPGSGPISGGTATGSPTDPGSPYVHAYDGGAGSDYEGSSPNAGMGGGGGGAGSVGSSTPDTVSPKGPWPAPQGAVSPTNMYGQGGNDYSVPTTFMPTDVVLGIAAEMGDPTSFLGVPVAPTFSPTPYGATLLFAGGGGGGSHGPWGNFNDNGEYPTGGGGSGSPTLPGWGSGGVGGNGGPTHPTGANNDVGHPGVNYRGGGGGGSAASPLSGGAGGHGICIVAYPIV